MTSFAQPNAKQLGFTLIELMIVVAIIGVLSSMAIPAYQNYIKKAEFASALATMKSLLTPAEIYYQQYGEFSASQSTAIFAALGISSGTSTLGNIEVKANELTFSFQSSAIATNTMIGYSRTISGWQCTTTLANGESSDIVPDSCPVSQP